MAKGNDKDLAVEKLQNALLKLPKDDLVKLLKNTYQAMRIKHSIPYEKKLAQLSNENTNHTGYTKNVTKKSVKSGVNVKNVSSKTKVTRSSNEAEQVVDEIEKDDQDTHENMYTIDTNAEEQPTFRKVDVDVPQLDLSLVRCRDVKEELRCNSDDGRVFRLSKDKDEIVQTPTFSPRCLKDEDVQVDERVVYNVPIENPGSGMINTRFESRPLMSDVKDDLKGRGEMLYGNYNTIRMMGVGSDAGDCGMDMNGVYYQQQYPQIMYPHGTHYMNSVGGYYPGSNQMNYSNQYIPQYNMMPYVRKMNVQRPFGVRSRSLQRL